MNSLYKNPIGNRSYLVAVFWAVASGSALLGGNVLADNFFVSNFQSSTISKVSSTGVVSQFADSSLLNRPMGLAVDLVGRLYVANQFGNTLVRYDVSGVGSVFANAGMDQPIGIALDGSGNVFVANAGNNTIMKYDSSGVGTLFADGSSGIANPVGLAIDGSDNVYVASQFLGKVHKFTPAGSGTEFASGMNQPYGLDVVGSSLLVGTAGDSRVVMFDMSGTGTEFANSGIANPIGVTADSGGNIYVANYYLNSLTKFTPGGASSVFVASGLANPTFVVSSVPEPSVTVTTLAMVGAAIGIRRWHRSRRG